jgi:hypothetical protein
MIRSRSASAADRPELAPGLGLSSQPLLLSRTGSRARRRRDRRAIGIRHCFASVERDVEGIVDAVGVVGATRCRARGSRQRRTPAGSIVSHDILSAMKREHLRAYAQRAWHLAEAHKHEHWVRKLAERGPLATFEASQASGARISLITSRRSD